MSSVTPPQAKDKTPTPPKGSPPKQKDKTPTPPAGTPPKPEAAAARDATPTPPVVYKSTDKEKSTPPKVNKSAEEKKSPVKAPSPEPAKTQPSNTITAPTKPRSKVPSPPIPAAKPKSRELNDINFNQIEDELKKIKTRCKDENLTTHLDKIFKQIILHQPDKGLERFEELSYLIKEGKDLNEFLCMEDKRSTTAVACDLGGYQDRVKEHFVQPEADEEGVIPQAEPLSTEVPDLLADSRILAWAGIGFGEQETYLLQKSLKKFATAKPFKSINFFGKIYGTERDYYVIECEGEVEGDEDEADAGGDDDGEPDAKLEGKGTGVNEFTYYVSQDALSDWIKLPDLSYQEVIAARQIKVLFTGNLERKIYTNPFFFGQEKHYLRAQISRISHSTSLFPKGLMRLVEDDETLRSVERNDPEEGELKMPDTSAMNDLSMWVHAKTNILVNGRTTHLDPEEPAEMPEGEEFDPEEAKKEIEAADPFDPRLKPLTSDASVAVTNSMKMPAWSVRICGDTTEYKDEKTAGLNVSNAVVIVRSQLWPGAYSLYYKGRTYQIYLGNGHKNSRSKNMFPVNPPIVCDDDSEYGEEPEPTPLEAPAVEEAKDGGEEEGEEEQEEDDDE